MKNLKIDRLSSNRFDESELAKLTGGMAAVCGCVSACLCRYANQGGSSTNDNADANGNIAANRTHNADNVLTPADSLA